MTVLTSSDPKLFFTAPPAELPFKQSFVTVEYSEEEHTGESLLRRLTVQDSGTVIKVLHETAPPFDDDKSEEFKIAYRNYLRELEASYGQMRKGQWCPSRKTLHRTT